MFQLEASHMLTNGCKTRTLLTICRRLFSDQNQQIIDISKHYSNAHSNSIHKSNRVEITAGVLTHVGAAAATLQLRESETRERFDRFNSQDRTIARTEAALPASQSVRTEHMESRGGGRLYRVRVEYRYESYCVVCSVQIQYSRLVAVQSNFIICTSYSYSYHIQNIP